MASKIDFAAADSIVCLAGKLTVAVVAVVGHHKCSFDPFDYLTDLSAAAAAAAEDHSCCKFEEQTEVADSAADRIAVAVVDIDLLVTAELI